MLNIPKHIFVRIISFVIAAITALTAALAVSTAQARAANQSLANHHVRAAMEICRNFENIKNTLQKSMYSNSALMLAELSAKLASDADSAKAALSQLPVPEADLNNLYKYLSQVGNYSKSLSKRAAAGEPVSDEERANLVKLYEYAVRTSGNMWNADFHDFASPPAVTDGFRELEDVFSDYPMLIYDGPFSDHIMQKKPLMLMNTAQIDAAEALGKAVSASGNESLTLSWEEDGYMPSYVFTHGNTTVAVTKSGGFISYMLGYRAPEAERISPEQAVTAARRYLARLGINQLSESYYELRDGVCMVNFAATQDGITLYTDLIKVGVAMDTGEVISVDARGYLVNHNPDGRMLAAPALSADEAAAFISPFLSIENVKLCLIPSEGMVERFCYEFKGTVNAGEDLGRRVLVYINADTGAEEQILLLEVTAGGILAV